MSQASLIMKKICEGLESSELSKLAASIIISIPFNWANLCDSVKQFKMRIKVPQHQQNLHAIAIPPRERRKLVCYRCSADHLLKDCRELQCRYCGEQHKHADCAKSGQKMFCSLCKSTYHNNPGHFKYAPPTVRPRRSDINLIEATSFLDGAVSTSSGISGESFVNTKLLVDTGALIPSGVAISLQFFLEKLGGAVEQLIPSDLNSANGASSNSTMKTVGQLEVRIRFNNLSTTF